MYTFSKITTWIFILCFNLLGFRLYSQPLVIENYSVLPKVNELRRQLLEIAESQVGVRELTGNNDGKQIKAYLKSVG